jgi:hypothetical protein
MGLPYFYIEHENCKIKAPSVFMPNFIDKLMLVKLHSGGNLLNLLLVLHPFRKYAQRPTQWSYFPW